MMVPEPKPTEPGARTRMRTTVSHGLGFSKTGSSRRLVDRARAGPWGPLRPGLSWVAIGVSRSASASSASAFVIAIGVGPRVRGGLGLGPGIQVEPGELSGWLASRGSAQLSARGIDHDEGGDRVHTIFLFQVRSLIDIDGLDRIAVSLERGHGLAHLAARPAPLGVEIEEHGLGGRRSSMAWQWQGRAEGRRVSCRKDSFPSGLTAGLRDGVVPGRDQLGAPRLDWWRGTRQRLGLGSRGVRPDRPRTSRPGLHPVGVERTFRVLLSGRRRRKKPM